MSMKLHRRKNGATEKLLKNLKSIDRNHVQVGHFVEQGNHSDSKLTYPDLLSIWAHGVAKNNEGVIRNPLAILESGINNPELKAKLSSDIDAWSSSALKNSASEALFDSLGESVKDFYKNIFGVVGPLMPPDSTNTPMLETGELRDATAYKTKNGKIKEG